MTTMKIKSSADVTSIRWQLKLGFSKITDYEAALCYGAGFGLAGPGVEYCDDIVTLQEETQL